MKGPGMRLDLDVRRLWRCPSCDAERRTPGDRTALHCTICSDHPLMALIERTRPVRPVAQPLDSTIEIHPDDVDAPPQLPPGMTTEPTTNESPHEAAVERVTPPPRTEPSLSERQKRSGKRQSRRRSQRETTEEKEPTSAATATAPTATAPTATADATNPTIASDPIASDATAIELTAPKPDQTSSPDPVEPEAFGDGVLDG